MDQVTMVVDCWSIWRSAQELSLPLPDYRLLIEQICDGRHNAKSFAYIPTFDGQRSDGFFRMMERLQFSVRPHHVSPGQSSEIVTRRIVSFVEEDMADPQRGECIVCVASGPILLDMVWCAQNASVRVDGKRNRVEVVSYDCLEARRCVLDRSIARVQFINAAHAYRKREGASNGQKIGRS